mmetsp:Transcript_41710/g.133074  ORF Transcript_41710/g.133074 Transcript_41710/m.133074 type:complete len:255 (-) Transcript_41710:332-1096(-)
MEELHFPAGPGASQAFRACRAPSPILPLASANVRSPPNSPSRPKGVPLRSFPAHGPRFSYTSVIHLWILRFSASMRSSSRLRLTPREELRTSKGVSGPPYGELRRPQSLDNKGWGTWGSGGGRPSAPCPLRSAPAARASIVPVASLPSSAAGVGPFLPCGRGGPERRASSLSTISRSAASTKWEIVVSKCSFTAPPDPKEALESPRWYSLRPSSHWTLRLGGLPGPPEGLLPPLPLDLLPCPNPLRPALDEGTR